MRGKTSNSETMSSTVTTTTTTYETRTYAFPNMFGTWPEKIFPFRYARLIAKEVFKAIMCCLLLSDGFL